MSALFDSVNDTFPANNDVGVPLRSDITVTLDGLDYNVTGIQEGFFVEGPDTDQYVGPGLIEQTFPANISQGDLDDFLQSPGYAGLVGGTVTVSGVAGDTVATFSSTLPLAPLTEYIVSLTDITNLAGDTVSGFVSFSFTTGTGSIETIPDTVSTSVLSAALPESATTSTSDPLEVVSITPEDRSIQHDPDKLREIIIEFNKELDPASITAGLVDVQAIPATDHPSVNINAVGEVAKTVEVDGKKLKIKI